MKIVYFFRYKGSCNISKDKIEVIQMVILPPTGSLFIYE